MTTPPSASSARRHAFDDAPTEHLPSADHSPRPDDKAAAGLVVWRWVSFIAGCALLVACAWALGSKITGWTRDYGSIVVFLCFFLVMSIAGRWFWMGIDTALKRVISGRG